MAGTEFKVGDKVRVLAVANWPHDWNVESTGRELVIVGFRDNNPELRFQRGKEALFGDNRPWPVASLVLVTT